MIDPNNIINKMLGTKPKKDCKSKNKQGTYTLKWKGEIIEEDIPNLKEAKYLQQEYNMAYQGGVSIIKN